MATCLVHMRVKDGQAAAFEAIARDLYEASTGKEPGLRRYEYWRGREPNSYYCLESFDDYAGFIAHEIAPHHEAVGEPIMAMIATTFTIENQNSASPYTFTELRLSALMATKKNRLEVHKGISGHQKCIYTPIAVNSDMLTRI